MNTKLRLELIRAQIKALIESKRSIDNKTDKINKLTLWEMKVLSQLEKEVFYDAG